MAGTFKFELVSPERILVSGEATEVLVPGMDGQFTVFAGHAPVISTLRPGTMLVTMDGRQRRVYVRSGIVEVEPDSVTVLAQQLIDLDGQGEAVAKAISDEVKAAETLLAGTPNDAERMAAEDTLGQLRNLARA